MRSLSWLLVLLLAATIINYPNPFNPKGGDITTFECTPTETSEAFLYIYDMSARLVQRIAFNLQGGAINRTSWDGYSNQNQLVGNSIYLYQLIENSRNRIGKGKIWVINK
ncbi:MAG: hypothetical protein U9R38_05270 [Candidatus Margulisiibacteriota bacterium]|nr:hypothetical protein [Candidatus Margulisiibacteriota bacterium]